MAGWPGRRAAAGRKRKTRGREIRPFFCAAVLTWGVLFSSISVAFGDYNAGQEAYRKAWDSYSRAEYVKAAEEAAVAIRLDPENPHARSLAGDIAYLTRDLDAAVFHWNKALALDPRLRAIRERIDQVSAERELEKGQAAASSDHFVVRTPKGSTLSPGMLLKELETVQRFLEEKLAFQFSGPTTVLVYEPERFYGEIHLPTEVAGLFDGTIRIPLRSGGKGPSFREVLWHEAAHAAVHQLTAGKAPRWLHEGVAQLAQAQNAPIFTGDLRVVLRQSEAPMIEQLQIHSSPFVMMDAGVPFRKELFYQASWAYCAYLVEQRGWEGLRRLLVRIRSDEAPDRALTGILGVKLPELERQWRRWVSERLQAP